MDKHTHTHTHTHTHKGILFNHLKKICNLPQHGWTLRALCNISKESQKEEDKHVMISLMCVES